MTATITINSDDRLDDVDHHFRVTAGPGAGKTFWLARHIEQVARISKRLTPCSRIAVISYTNVAVREIVGRLGTVALTVDASTIHSFLYRNVVRPYVHLLKDAAGEHVVAHRLVETHDVHVPHYTKLDEWVRAAGKARIMGDFPQGSLARLQEQLCALKVRISPSGQADFEPRTIDGRDRALADLFVPQQILSYKQRYWAEGILDHEDVLYFAYRILHEFPALRQFCSDRFPYLFIDEFQDTVPVQAQLVRWLADAGTTIGVIGDPEQAIFGFLDASAEHFCSFALDGHQDYTIVGNRRSTRLIVELLNHVRTDGLQQHDVREADGVPAVAYSGSLGEAIAHARDSTPLDTPFLILARKHETLHHARLQTGGQLSDPWLALMEVDAPRARFLNCVASAMDLAQRKFFDLAIQKLVQGISTRNGFRKPLAFAGAVDLIVRRSFALALLEHLIAQHDALSSATTLDFYNAIANVLPTCLPGISLQAVRAGRFQTLASAQRYHDLFQTLRTPDETRWMRTIHQAKGAEAAAVFVVLEDAHVDHILTPTANQEEQRVIYVALSRAIDHLFIFCPNPARLAEFEPLGMATVSIGSPPATAQPKQSRSRRRSGA